MKINNGQLDFLGIPQWIGNFCNQHQTLLLSDTRTYRLLMVIFRSIIEMNISVNASEADREEMLMSFMMWFLRLKGGAMPAWLGLMWVYQGIGEKLMAAKCDGQIAPDERHSRMLMAFIAILDEDGDDPSAEHYYNMICEGLANCDQEKQMESLYRGFVATFEVHSYHELTAIWEEHGFSESQLKKSLRSSAAYMAELAH